MPAVIFKGSGFYSTDNRGSGTKGGRTSSSDTETTPTPALSTDTTSDNGHGHSHGPGGHTHDATPAKVDASA
jgi:hypothetical protein